MLGAVASIYAQHLRRVAFAAVSPRELEEMEDLGGEKKMMVGWLGFSVELVLVPFFLVGGQ